MLVFVCCGDWFGFCVFALVHELGCGPGFCVFLCWEWRRGPGWGWLSVGVLWTPGWFALLAVLMRWSRYWSCSLVLCGLFCGRFVVCLALCHFVLVFFGPFGVAVASLGEEGGLVLVLFVFLVCLCLFGFVGFLFLLVSGKGCGL